MAYRWWFGASLWFAASAAAASHEFVIPLAQGKLSIRQVNAPIAQELHLPNPPGGGELSLADPAATDFLGAMNACLWRGCSMALRGDTAVLRLTELAPESLCRRASRMTRIIAAEEYPAATAAQARRWGLALPGRVEPNRPLVVLIHGLDADRNDCVPMGELLRQLGWQVAYFSYPGDQPIDDSAALLARSMRDLRERFPQMRVDFVAHSMGGLIARDYVEGLEYAGGVDRLIMIAPPNHGSSWAHLRSALSVQKNFDLRRDDADWRWSWLITEGMGEAGSDLLPGSEFLAELNARPRRAGVNYTIVAGNRSAVARVEADWIESLGSCVPAFARTWWGLRYCYRGLHDGAERMRTAAADTDGVVLVENVTIDGVKDFVILPADHRSLFLPEGGQAPAALPVVIDRLRR
ncbi:MAG TPA: alpha/beta fold hydrolase [Tepidisphaeraceae bacterium]|jgi:pimeloyl-ACP methyl ester carboxylesterase|nr:alpha/beta fold hydrolase [Tepidisphaeraceae bacterium]